jgi:hypothetical protein
MKSGIFIEIRLFFNRQFKFVIHNKIRFYLVIDFNLKEDFRLLQKQIHY